MSTTTCSYRRTHVIFDRYNMSIKDATRCQRACEAAREYKLTMNAPLPQQQVVFSVTKNKVQLIDVICEELQQFDDVPLNTSLVITIRYNVWVSSTGRNGASILPKLKSLPPTVEAFKENVKRAHFQAGIWKAALQHDPPELDPLEFGWPSEGPSGAYCRVSLPSKVEVAPSYILKLINCSCSSDRPCSSQRCSCGHLRSWHVHCSASVKAAEPAAIPILFP